jgi:septal ring factor EnvC (AmiA/AmiB activator)
MGVSALAAAGLLVALSFKLYQTQQEVQRLQGLVASQQTTITEREEALQAGRRELQRATEMVATLQAELAKREATLEANSVNGSVSSASWRRCRASSASAMQRFAYSRPHR